MLRAVGIRCDVLPLENEFALFVHARDADRAQKQLELYLHENRVRSPRFDPRLGVYDGLKCACLYGVTILLMDLLQRHQAFSLDWWDAGKSHAGLIQQGEWWRTFTALSLHADPVHLLGNLIFGVLFSFLAGQRLGWGLAWAGMLLAGALGNALNAFIQLPGHMSIGASTAVFATLGILSSYCWKQRQHRINRWVPVGSGIALLAFLGMGGERTDIFAHLAGFGRGMPARRPLWVSGEPPRVSDATSNRFGFNRCDALRRGLVERNSGAWVISAAEMPSQIMVQMSVFGG